MENANNGKVWNIHKPCKMKNIFTTASGKYQALSNEDLIKEIEKANNELKNISEPKGFLLNPTFEGYQVIEVEYEDIKALVAMLSIRVKNREEQRLDENDQTG